MSFKMTYTLEQKKEIERLLRLRVPIDKICKIMRTTRGRLTNEIYRQGFNRDTYNAEKSHAEREAIHKAAIKRFSADSKNGLITKKRLSALEKEVEMLKMQIEILIDHIKGENNG